MTDSIRDALYYCGFLSGLAFFARFLIQWTYSEWQKKSVVPTSFWKISLTGNLLALLHALLQQQLHVFIVQVLNGCISWRNLNLLGPSNQRWSYRHVLFLFLSAIALGFSLFLLIGIGVFHKIEFFRIPNTPWSEFQEVTGGWHLFGTFGLLLFSLRFWVQWWLAEQQQQSGLQPSFWWLSLMGGIFTLIYFCHLGDAVNAIGPLFGLIPYLRNLMLIKNRKEQPLETPS